MPMYKEHGVIANGLSLADRGKPGCYVPFASVFTRIDGQFQITRQFMWSELELPSVEAAKDTAERLAQRAIDRGDIGQV
jgi:hypothetical protein